MATLKLTTRIRLMRLKSRAKQVYLAHRAEVDSMECGMAVAVTINPRINRTARLFNKLMDDIAKLDPDCPNTRLEIVE